MSDIIIYTTLVSSILVILFILSLFLKRSRGSSQDETERLPNAARREPAVQVRRVGGRVIRSRLHRARQARELEEDENNEVIDDESSDAEDEAASSVVLPEGKIGAKKRKKLEMKAEKRAQREQELQEREQRKQQQAILEEQQKAEEEKQRLEEEKQKEEDKRLKEEKARQELEEYLKLKETFQIESEGFDEEVAEEGQDLYKDFISYIINEKVVQLEDLAVRFKLKTQDAIDRLNCVLSSGELSGVMDDRGKFIYISKEELKAVAKFINLRGRVTISELAENSNLLINMNPKGSTIKSAA